MDASCDKCVHWDNSRSEDGLGYCKLLYKEFIYNWFCKGYIEKEK